MSFPPEALLATDRRALLELARNGIVSAIAGHTLQLPRPEPPCFSMRRDVFVTVHVAGRLRGCIGVLDTQEVLRDTIVHCAQSAVLRDARFSPVRAEELDDLQIEISVLSEITPISPAQVEIGRHGLYIASTEGRGLLLPQVAVEHRLSREEFIEETCRKAGLPRDAWHQPGTQLFAFTCDVFHDRRAGNAGAPSTDPTN